MIKTLEMIIKTIDYKFYLLLILSYLGLFIGIIISHFTKEELTKGKKYFKILKSIIFSLVIFIFFQRILNIYITIFISLLMFIFSYIFEKKNNLQNNLQFLDNIVYYSFYSIALFETRKTEITIIVTLLIFIFGMVISSIQCEELKELKFLEKIYTIMPLYLFYLIIGVFLSLIF